MSRPIAFLFLILSVTAYVIGVSIPIATVFKETLFSQEAGHYSVLSTIEELDQNGETGLAVLIGIFSIVFPIAKYLSLATALMSGSDPHSSAIFRLMKKLGKWSMLDVFVIALLVVMMKINGQDHWYLSTHMQVEPGLFVYAFSVLSAMVLASSIGVMTANSADPIHLSNGCIVRPCGFWIRLWAAMIDAALAAVIVLPIMFKVYGSGYFESDDTIRGGVDLLFNWVLPPVVTIVFWAFRQATPGKMLIGARIVDANTGRPVSVGRLIGRYVGYYLAILPLGVGIFWLALDPRRQGWHDKVARTLVVEAD